MYRTAVLLFSIWLCALPRAAAQGSGSPPSQANRPPVSAVSSERLTLDELLAEAERVNPELRAASYRLRAARARIRPAGALPDPVVSVEQMNVGNLLPLTTLGEEDMTRLSFGVMQEIPYKGKRGLREKIAEKEADAERWEYELTRLRIVAEIKAAYYDLFHAHQALEILAKNRGLLDTHAALASALYKVGEGSQADVLKAQTALSRLEDRIAIAAERRGIAEAQINALLDRPADTPLGRPQVLVRAALRYSFAELVEMAGQNFPLLRRQQELIAAGGYELRLAEKEKYPDFGVMFSYSNRAGLRDIWSFGATARIPLYFGRKQKHQIEEADARLAAARAENDGIAAMLRFQVKDHYLSATTSAKLLDLFEKTIIPQETLTLEATAARYRVGQVDFLSVLDSLTKLLDDELSYYDHLTGYQKALARLEPLVGVELTRP